jgi:hypothetical protein
MDALAGATTSGQYLRGNGTDVVMAAIVAGDVPTLNQNTTGTASNVTGTVAVLNGGTGSTTAAGARTNLGATTVGSNFFTLANPTAVTFPRMNADNTVSALDAATFRTAIGAGTSSTTGTVTSVSGTSPISVATGTTTPAISIAQATSLASGYLTSTDWGTFNGKQAALVSGTNIKTVNSTSLLGSGDVSVGVTSVTGTAPVVSSGGATPAISMAAATTSVNGYLTSTDWTTFNNKQAALGFTPYNATNPSNYIALASAITGYTVGTNTALAATDTLLAGLGKIQGQINARGTGNGTVTSVGGTGSYGGLTLSGTVTTSGNLTLGGTPTGTWPISVSGASTSCSGNAATATTLIGDQSNWASYRSSAVANMLSWKNYGNGHIIFDASASTSPTGSAVNNTNAQIAWTGTYPTLMGWNGTNTYGVRVDSARISDSTSGSSASCTGNAATATTATTCNGNYNTTNAQQNGSDGWWRSTGSAGWYSTTYAVGIYSVGAGLVQTYNSSSFQANGALYATGNVTAYYSDERLKTNLGNVKNALDSVCKLNGFRYINNEVAKSVGYENEEVQLGVSAQEVEALFPEIVSIAPFDMLHNEETGAISSKSGEEYKTVDYARLVPVLIEAIKELKAEVDELKKAK